MPESGDSERPPEFDTAFGDEDVEQRIYGTILRTREPASAADIAERVDCDPKTARKYLSWFTDLGVVVEHDGRPTTYERNDAYFDWRRVNELASTHSLPELQRRVSELTDEIAAYRDEYDADSPGEIDVLEYDASRIDAVYEDLSEWATARRERRLYERARQQVADSSAETHG